jgi:hypothetical protein
MNKAESDRLHQLCSLIAKEQDWEQFLTYVTELNRILSEKEERLRSVHPGEHESG